MILSKSHQTPTKTEVFRSTFANLKLTDEPNPTANILRLLRYYKANKTHIDEVVARNVLLSELPLFLYERHVEDSSVVCTLLRNIQDGQHLVFLIHFLVMNGFIFKTLPPQTIKDRNADGKASFCFLTYFLHHAYRQKMTFGGKKLLEVMSSSNPALISKLVFFCEPRCLLSLLQYGLRFETSESDRLVLHPVYAGASELLSFVIQSEAPDADVASFASFVRNFPLLLLAARNPRHALYRIRLLLQKVTGLSEQELDPFLKSIFPKLDFFDSLTPLILQHYCRNAIRDRLDQSWRLPYGVWKLPVQRSLQKYLSFTADVEGKRTLSEFNPLFFAIKDEKCHSVERAIAEGNENLFTDHGHGTPDDVSQ